MSLFNRAKLSTEVSLFQLFLVWLALANLSYLYHDLIGWTLTLSYFFIVPGFLILCLLKAPKLHIYDRVALSAGLSILFLIITGLAVNTLGTFGVRRPLSTINIFAAVDLLSFVLTLLNFSRLSNRSIKISKLELGFRECLAIVVAILMPLLAIFGAIRLNNGGSDILTMILLCLLPALLLWLLLDKQLSRVHVLTIFSMALALLFTTSLRGWQVTGHDIQHEYLVFQLALRNQHWSIATFRNPYNACLSITILPVVITKLTAVHSIYVYKIVFQVLFASATIPLYRFLKKFNKVYGVDNLALLGTFMFMAFITFLNDMPFINRQEIAFIFFILLLLVNFSLDLTGKVKATLTILTITGLVLSHYSTAYVMLFLFLLASIFYRAIAASRKKYRGSKNPELPTLFNYRILLIALLVTFLWNTQLTATSKGLSTTIKETVASAINNNGAKSPDVTGTLFGGEQATSAKMLKTYVSNHHGDSRDIQLVGAPVMPPSTLGSYLSKYIPRLINMNALIKSLASDLEQLLVIFGTGVILFRIFRLRHSDSEIYVACLSLAAIVLLGTFTLLPDLSVSYGVLRVFQQLMPILCIPIIFGFITLFSFSKRLKSLSIVVFVVFLFYEVSGFIPQLLGGYAPQLALNNAGQYYDAYYIHESEITSAAWALSHLKPPNKIDMDYFAELRFINDAPNTKLKLRPLLSTAPGTYIYQDYANATTNLYEIYSNGYVVWYRLKGPIMQPLIYTDGSSNVYGK